MGDSIVGNTDRALNNGDDVVVCFPGATNTRVEQILMSGILPVIGSRGQGFRNCRWLAINPLVHHLCREEEA